MNEICLSCRKYTKCGRAKVETIGCGYYVPMTNEEWLRSATFDEMAGIIYEWYSQGHIEGKFGKQLTSATRVVEWLKEKHNDNWYCI